MFIAALWLEKDRDTESHSTLLSAFAKSRISQASSFPLT